MTKVSFKLAQAVAGGREANGAPQSREVILERLLRKRAAAYQAGLAEQEQLLRDQIVWALPMTRLSAASGAGVDAEVDHLLGCAQHYRQLESAGVDGETASGLRMLADACEDQAVDLVLKSGVGGAC